MREMYVRASVRMYVCTMNARRYSANSANTGENSSGSGRAVDRQPRKRKGDCVEERVGLGCLQRRRRRERASGNEKRDPHTK